MKRGWIALMVLAGLLGRTALLPLLFWCVHPLWLVAFWGLQGYPTGLADLARWYAPGAFNLVPSLAWLLLGLPLVMGLTMVSARWGHRHRAPLVFGTAAGGLMVPPLAYALLLIYAGVWQYRAWEVMLPTLWHAYLMLAPSCGLVGAVAGWLTGQRQTQ
jgi:hypothetical protein